MKAIAEVNAAIAGSQKDEAVSNAAKAAAIEGQKATTETAKFMAEKAKADYYKTLIPTLPDFTKLKAEKTANTPVFTAKINSMLFENTVEISKKIANTIKDIKDLNPIIINDPLIQQASGLKFAVKATLDQSNSVLDNERAILDSVTQTKKSKPRDEETEYLSMPVPLVIDAVSSILQNVIGFTNALKPQFSTANTVLTPNTSEFIDAVCEQLIANKVEVIYPDKIIAIEAEDSALKKSYVKLEGTITKSQALIERLAQDSSIQGSEPTQAAIIKFKSTLNEIIKIRQTLITASSTGVVPYDQAIKAENFLKKLGNKSAVLSIDLMRGDADSVNRNSTFSSEKNFILTNLQIRWSLTRTDGAVVGAGIVQDTKDWLKVELPK